MYSHLISVFSVSASLINSSCTKNVATVDADNFYAGDFSRCWLNKGHQQKMSPTSANKYNVGKNTLFSKIMF